MVLEVKNHSHPLAGPYSWVVYRPEWENNFFSLKLLTIYTVRKLVNNWANINKRVGSENELVTSYSRLKILKNLGKVTILILVNVPVVNKVTVCIENC